MRFFGKVQIVNQVHRNVIICRDARVFERHRHIAIGIRKFLVVRIEVVGKRQTVTVLLGLIQPVI